MSDKKRYALIIANSLYDKVGLAQLKAPAEDAETLVGLLSDPAIGHFDEVKLALNEPRETLSRLISEFFAVQARDELRLLYFSGHGLLDDKRRLFLATRDTEPKHHLLDATAIPARFITERMDYNRAKQQILILDCCYSGAFEIANAKGSTVIGISVGTKDTFERKEGRGRIVLTATDSVQQAWEGERFIGESRHSLFTHYLVQGLQTGEADTDGDEYIKTQEWFDYARERVIEESSGEQTPRRWAYGQEGDLIVARSIRPVTVKKPVNTRHLPDEGPFVGRQDDLAVLQTLFDSKKLMILEGLSGIGKSSLALHYAYQTASEYDAVIWYEIQESDTVESVLVNIALQLNDSGYSTLLDVVTDPQKSWQNRNAMFFDEIRQRHLLLVLDSFNQCLDESHKPKNEFASLLDGLLSKQHISRILLTTKVRINLNPTYSGKYGIHELQGLGIEAALSLFLRLCSEVGHVVTQDEAAAICRAVDGHPFALKIIVALLRRGYFLEQLLGQMRDRVTEDYGHFLLDIIYQTLSTAAQTLLQACSVYRRPIRQAALKRLPADESKLHELLPYFLLEVEPHSRRYFMHTIVREYAYAKLLRDEERHKKAHIAAGNYLAAGINDPNQHRDDFQTTQRILEAQYHYRVVGDEAGIVATSVYIADELKPLVRKLYREGKNELAGQLYRAILAVNEQDAEMHYYYARILERQNKPPEEIERHYREAIKLLPNHAEMQMRYIVWLTKQKKYTNAEQAFLEAVKHRGDNPSIYVPYAKALRSGNQFEEAIRVLRKGFQKVPPSADLVSLYLEYSQVLREQGKLDEALVALREGIQKAPPSSLVSLYIEYSQVLREQGKLDEVVVALREGIQKAPPSSLVSLYLEYSQVLREQGKLDEVVVALREGIQKVPPSSLVSLYLEYSQVLREQGKLDEALVALREGIQKVPPSSLASLYIEYSQVLREQGKLDEALVALREWIQKAPPSNLASLYFEYSQVLRAQGKLDKALVALREGIQKAPPSNLASLYIDYSQVLRAQGKLDEVVVALREGIQTVPSSALASLYFEYSQVLREQGKLDEAAAAVREGIQKVPPSAFASLYFEYSQILREQGKSDEAAAAVREGIQKVPPAAKGLLICGQANLLFEKEQFSEMAQLLDEAINTAPRFSTIYAYRACLHWLQNELEAAKTKFERGIDFKPNEATSFIYHYYIAFLLEAGELEKANELIRKRYNLPLDSPEVALRASELSSLSPESIWSTKPGRLFPQDHEN